MSSINSDWWHDDIIKKTEDKNENSLDIKKFIKREVDWIFFFPQNNLSYSEGFYRFINGIFNSQEKDKRFFLKWLNYENFIKIIYQTDANIFEKEKIFIAESLEKFPDERLRLYHKPMIMPPESQKDNKNTEEAYYHFSHPIKPGEVLNIDEFIAAMWIKWIKFWLKITEIKIYIESRVIWQQLIAKMKGAWEWKNACLESVSPKTQKSLKPKQNMSPWWSLFTFDNPIPQIKKGEVLYKKSPKIEWDVWFYVCWEIISPWESIDFDIKNSLGAWIGIIEKSWTQFLIALKDGYLFNDKKDWKIYIKDEATINSLNRETWNIVVAEGGLIIERWVNDNMALDLRKQKKVTDIAVQWWVQWSISLNKWSIKITWNIPRTRQDPLKTESWDITISDSKFVEWKNIETRNGGVYIDSLSITDCVITGNKVIINCNKINNCTIISNWLVQIKWKVQWCNIQWRDIDIEEIEEDPRISTISTITVIIPDTKSYFEYLRKSWESGARIDEVQEKCRKNVDFIIQAQPNFQNYKKVINALGEWKFIFDSEQKRHIFERMQEETKKNIDEIENKYQELIEIYRKLIKSDPDLWNHLKDIENFLKWEKWLSINKKETITDILMNKISDCLYEIQEKERYIKLLEWWKDFLSTRMKEKETEFRLEINRTPIELTIWLIKTEIFVKFFYYDINFSFSDLIIILNDISDITSLDWFRLNDKNKINMKRIEKINPRSYYEWRIIDDKDLLEDDRWLWGKKWIGTLINPEIYKRTKGQK